MRNTASVLIDPAKTTSPGPLVTGTLSRRHRTVIDATGAFGNLAIRRNPVAGADQHGLAD